MKMKSLLSTMLITYSGVCLSMDCLETPGKNCVDLCKVDPGNRLNLRDFERKEISRQYVRSCVGSGYNRGLSGKIYRVNGVVRYFSICTQQWEESQTGCIVN